MIPLITICTFWGPIHANGWGGNPPMENPPSSKFAYLNNYVAGLRILDISSGDVSSFEEVGYFDIAPDLDELSYLGAWSGYLHPSGVYAISSIDRGLFFLQPRMVFEEDNSLRELFATIATVLGIIAGLLIVVAMVITCRVYEQPDEQTAMQTRPPTVRRPAPKSPKEVSEEEDESV